MKDKGQLMTFKQASQATGINLNKLYYNRNNPEILKEYGLKCVMIAGKYFLRHYR